jgi:hypothetical protein
MAFDDEEGEKWLKGRKLRLGCKFPVVQIANVKKRILQLEAIENIRLSMLV